MRIFSGGSILTMRSEAPRAEALAIADDRILAVGDLDAVRAAAPGAEEVDLAAACLLPGFIDAHHHFSEGALFAGTVSLRWPEVRSVDEILKRVAARAAETPPGGWILAQGYDEGRLREGRGPTLSELDDICPENPVILVQYSYHEAIVNSRAHEVLELPIERPDPPGGEIVRDPRGRSTGRMIENAVAPFLVRAVADEIARDEEAYFAQLERYQERLLAAGVTRVHDAAVSPLMEQMLRRAAERGLLRLSVLMMLSSAEGIFLPPRDRLGAGPTGDGADPLRTGPLKLFMDGGERAALALPLGVVAGLTVGMFGRMLRHRSLAPLRAAGISPLRWDPEGRCLRGGILFYEEAEARQLVNAAVEHRLTVAIHAEGNVAIDRALRVLPPSPDSRPPGVGPHRIEHFFFPDRDAIARAADLRLATAVQPMIAEWTGDRLLDMGLIGRRLFMPVRTMLDAGLTVAGSSDAPVVDFDPVAGIRAAVCRRAASGEELGDDQTVSAEQALEMYTLHAARAGGLEHEVGTLEPGKRADLVVLNSDPTALEPHELKRLAVVRTVCGGDDAYVCSA
jgi:predicted amidohydrolase YtcJ